MLHLEHIHKTYGGGRAVKAVDDLTLELRPGEIFGFIGPNGAGKTTTIKLAMGILQPDQGTVTVAGISMAKDPIRAKQAIGYAPDAMELYDRLKGMEYLNMMADIYGVSQDDRMQRIQDYLTRFELQDAMGDPLHSYSRGMRQKLVIIGALLHKPTLWMLDEPLTGLDPRSSHVLKQEMRVHADAGNTVFFSTHVLEVAEKLCDRIGIINHGRLVAVGRLDELRQSGDASLESTFLQITEGVSQ